MELPEEGEKEVDFTQKKSEKKNLKIYQTKKTELKINLNFLKNIFKLYKLFKYQRIKNYINNENKFIIIIDIIDNLI